MGKIKEDLKLIDYLNEKGISYSDLKLMVEQSINSALEKEGETEDQEKATQTEEQSEEEQEEVPTFTKEDIQELVQLEVKEALKIKRKVPSKGKIIKPEEKTQDNEPIQKNWFEVLV